MLIDKRRFDYVTHHTIEKITNYLKATLEAYGFKVRIRKSDSSESYYLHIYYFHQILKEIRISNHAPKEKTDYDISASFDRPGAINCHDFLIHFLDSLCLPHPEQTMNYEYIQNLLKALKTGKLKLGFSRNIIVKANSRPCITVTRKAI